MLAAEAATAKQEARNSIQFAFIVSLILSLVFVGLYRTYQVKQKFKVLAQKDELTGLKNRREFYRLASEAITAGKKADMPVSMIIMDLDHFKVINDTHGHAVGDMVLKLVATQLQQECRKNDVVARLGGEEFGIVLPFCEGAKATEIAEGLRAKIAAIDTSESGHTFTVTASFGVAENPKSQLSYDTLFSESDTALYRSKNEGRNRVYLASSAKAY